MTTERHITQKRSLSQKNYVSQKNYISVAISGPLKRSFTYHTDQQTFDSLTPGALISVPFGKKRVRGFYLAECSRPKFATKAIGSILESKPFSSARKFSFYLWLADYYFANPADVLALALPPGSRTANSTEIHLHPQAPAAELDRIPERVLDRLRLGKSLSKRDQADIETVLPEGIVGLLSRGALTEKVKQGSATGRRLIGYRIHHPETVLAAVPEDQDRPTLSDSTMSRSRLKEAGISDYRLKKLVTERALEPVYADPVDELLASLPMRGNVRNITLNKEQQSAVDTVSPEIGKKFSPYLLHGVTGSGKTLVYCHLIRAALNLGKTALLMTPEIVLAGETLAYLRGFFDEEIALWHSGLSGRQKNELWQKLRAGELRILVGPRSALFAPLEDPGIIIVDEEHDESYKQADPAPRFQGRDSAVMLARELKIPIVLGSGTPSVESYHNVKRGRYKLLQLTGRPSGVQQPEIRLVDMKKERLGGEHSFMSHTLKQEVDRRLETDEQVILYLNRRGFSPKILCRDCDHVPGCPDCMSSLTYHKRGERLICHLCGYTRNSYTNCEKCHSADLLRPGAGTQKLEESVLTLFPNARGVRLDSDVTGGKNNAWRILREFAERKYNLLIGTQMISKGLDLPDVTLVGALLSDADANLVDFRAGEKTFSKLTQVAGRGGRAKKKGLALTQTYSPESDLMREISRGDFTAFFEREVRDRKTLGYPPYSHLARFVLQSEKEEKLTEVAFAFREKLQTQIPQSRLNYTLLGPAPCQMYRLRGRYRRHLLIFSKQIQKFIAELGEWEGRETRFGLPSAVRITVDVDPYDFM